MLIDKFARATLWAFYRARLARWAWCEVSGGHEYGTWGAFMRCDTDLASKIRTECSRCGKGTPWIDTPTRGSAPAQEKGEQR